MLVTFGLTISVWFLSDPRFIRLIPYFLCPYLFSAFHCAGNICDQVSVECLRYLANDNMHTMHRQGEGGLGAHIYISRLN